MEEGPEPIIVKLIQLAAGQHYNIDTRQFVLVQAESFANMALDAIALDGEADVLLANDQAEARALQLVGYGKHQQMPVRYLELGLGEDPLIVLTVQQA